MAQTLESNAFLVSMVLSEKGLQISLELLNFCTVCVCLTSSLSQFCLCFKKLTSAFLILIAEIIRVL